jgi:hypothetical protein
MDSHQKITYGAIGLIALIVAALGGTIYLTPDQLDHAYICSANQNVIIADHLSSTAKTAYWYDETNTLKSKVCTNGLWINLKQYAKDNNLAINVLLQNINIENDNSTILYGHSYRCDQTKCIKID